MNSLVTSGTATKQSSYLFDGKPTIPVYVVTLVIPVGELVEVIDGPGADLAVAILGQAVLDEIRQLDGKVGRT